MVHFRVPVQRAAFVCGCLMMLLGHAGCNRKKPTRVVLPLAVRTRVVAYVAHPRTASLTGEFRARIQSDLSFRVGGRIASRSVEVGDHVAAGDVLATIDSLQQQADVTAAKAALRSAEATKQQAAATVTRIERLIPTQSASQADYDDAKASLLTAEGSINIMTSNLATAESQLSFTKLKANAAGVIIARTAEVGQVVNAAQTVFTLAEDGDREAIFDAFQTHIYDRPVDDKIDLTLVSNPAVKTSGVIREIAPSIDPTSGTVRVKVTVPSPPPQMKLGAPVVGVAQFRATQVAKLPWTALAREGDQAAVWVVDPATRIVSRKVVQVESYQSGTLLVSSGLKDGDIVVTEGTQLLRPGQEVDPIGETK